MFYHIEGRVAELEPALAVIDCSGVGYALSITANTAGGLKLGEKAKLYVSESIGEDHFDLFGFQDKSERRFFELLIAVSGIGPKAAMSILSHNTPEGLALAIISGNEKALTVAPGIGKKIAQRLVLELKDKVDNDELTGAGASVVPKTEAGPEAEAVAALTALGYSAAEAAKAVGRVAGQTEKTDELIFLALKSLG